MKGGSDMEAMKMAMIGVGAVILALKFKGMNQEYSLYLSIAGGLILMGIALSQIGVLVAYIKTVYGYLMIDSIYLKILMKIIGLAYLCEFSSNLCKDAGYSSIAGQIEMAGKLSILLVSMPVMTALLDTLKSFLSS